MLKALRFVTIEWHSPEENEKMSRIGNKLLELIQKAGFIASCTTDEYETFCIQVWADMSGEPEKDEGFLIGLIFAVQELSDCSACNATFHVQRLEEIW